jgi:hypothetical protein
MSDSLAKSTLRDDQRLAWLRRFRSFADSSGGLALLLLIYLAVNWVSLAIVQRNAGVVQDDIYRTAIGIFLTISLVPLFVLGRFSFGYLAGLYFYGLIAGFTWITYFSAFNYDHAQERLSALGSLLMFLVPVIAITGRASRPAETSWARLSPRAMDQMLICGLAAAVVILAIDACYGFAFVSIADAEELRSSFPRPLIFNYVTGIAIYAVLPFAFAYFARRRRYGLSAVSVALIAMFYPIVLNKTVLFAAGWLPFLFLIFGIFEARRAAALSIVIPLATGLILYLGFAVDDGPPGFSQYVFNLVNFRMSAIPSIAMDYYSEFFSQYPHTQFCQINLVRMISGCAYPDQISVIFSHRYEGVGNFNASLFATEGIASVGPGWAPLAALICGLILSLGNLVSGRLPPQLVAVSAGLVLQALVNVALSTVLLSDGMATLFLLWLVTPEMSEAPCDPRGLGDKASAAPS